MLELEHHVDLPRAGSVNSSRLIDGHAGHLADGEELAGAVAEHPSRCISGRNSWMRGPYP